MQLDKKDLGQIKTIVGEIVQESEDRFKAIVEEIVQTSEVRLNKKIDGVETSLNQKIDGVETSLNKKIDGVETSLNKKIDGVETSLNKKIDGVETRLNEKIKKTVESSEKRVISIISREVSDLAQINRAVLEKVDTINILEKRLTRVEHKVGIIS